MASSACNVVRISLKSISCLRSALAAKSLKEMGFEKVSHVDGGFAAISQSDFKIV